MNIQEYLKITDVQFKDTFFALEKIVMRIFPKAEAGFYFAAPSFRVRLGKEEIKNWQGTMDPNYLCIGLARRARGISFYLYNPQDYYWLEKKKLELTKIGFKVMRACLAWNKKQSFPMETIESFLKELKNKLV